MVAQLNPTTPTRSRSTVRAAVLNAPRAAYPHPVAPETLHEIAGRPYPSRIGELVTDYGWDIVAVYHDGDPVPS